MSRYDSRNARTERAVKDALLDVLRRKPFSEVSVSEVAQAANVSRSTFYAHYDNLDQVFAALVSEQQANTRTLAEQLRCESCSQAEAPLPFCTLMRSPNPHAALMRDPHYLAAFIQNRGSIRGNDEYGKLEAQGLSSSTARALELFQLSGCYTAATNVATEEEWSNARAAIDEFIRGGLSAVRARLAEGKLA